MGEQTGAWLLTQGVLGFTTLGLIAVVWKLWTALQAAYVIIRELQTKDAELQRQTLERVLTSMNTMGSVVNDNTKVMETFLRGKP